MPDCCIVYVIAPVAVAVTNWSGRSSLTAGVHLVQTSVQAASEDSIRALQAALPLGLSQVPSPIQLENVKPTLLLPPTEKRGIASELAGGIFELGDRVACLKESGTGHQTPRTMCLH